MVFYGKIGSNFMVNLWCLNEILYKYYGTAVLDDRVPTNIEIKFSLTSPGSPGHFSPSLPDHISPRSGHQEL